MRELAGSSLFIVKQCPQDFVLGEFPLFAKYLIFLSVLNRFLNCSVTNRSKYPLFSRVHRYCFSSSLARWSLKSSSGLHAGEPQAAMLLQFTVKRVENKHCFYRIKPRNRLQQGLKNGTWNFSSVALAKIYFNHGEKIYLLFFPPLFVLPDGCNGGHLSADGALDFRAGPSPLGLGVDLKRRFFVWELKSRL